MRDMARAIYALIPDRWQPYAKTLVGAAGLLATYLTATLPDIPAWIAPILAAVGALGIYQTPNRKP